VGRWQEHFEIGAPDSHAQQRTTLPWRGCQRSHDLPAAHGRTATLPHTLRVWRVFHDGRLSMKMRGPVRKPHVGDTAHAVMPWELECVLPKPVNDRSEEAAASHKCLTDHHTSSMCALVPLP
jgi:hypothetical protein